MKKALILAAVFLVPMGITFWLGWQALERDRENMDRRVREALSVRVEAWNEMVNRRMVQLIGELETPWYEQPVHRTVERVMQTEGTRVTDPPLGNRSIKEDLDAARLEELLIMGPLGTSLPEGKSSSSPSRGWSVHRGGRETFYYWENSGNATRVIQLNTAALMAYLMEALPGTLEGVEEPEGHGLLLLDGHHRSFLRWGDFEPGPGETAPVVRPLTFPLDSWRWEYYLREDLRPGMGSQGWELLLYPSLILGAVLGFFVWYLGREAGRELREAENKVSFVNQVSHELKTPLTNLQLYADLAADRVEGRDPTLGGYLEVIQAESRRLGRMIHNVLTFSRRDRKDGADLRWVSPGEVCVEVVRSFGPSFRARNLELDYQPGLEKEIRTDPDLLGQILYNLVSNGEKYGAAGGKIQLTWEMSPGSVTFKVRDWGPGISPKDRERIFHPFVRLSDRITEGVSGAGLGLAISRTLAHRLGGTLKCMAGEPGACFELNLRWGE